jgi:hypothetical protein
MGQSDIGKGIALADGAKAVQCTAVPVAAPSSSPQGKPGSAGGAGPKGFPCAILTLMEMCGQWFSRSPF